MWVTRRLCVTPLLHGGAIKYARLHACNRVYTSAYRVIFCGGRIRHLSPSLVSIRLFSRASSPGVIHFARITSITSTFFSVFSRMEFVNVFYMRVLYKDSASLRVKKKTPLPLPLSLCELACPNNDDSYKTKTRKSVKYVLQRATKYFTLDQTVKSNFYQRKERNNFIYS